MQSLLISHSSKNYVIVLNILHLRAVLHSEISPGISVDCTGTNKKLVKVNFKHCPLEPFGCIFRPFLMCFWTFIKLSFQWGVTRLHLKQLFTCPFFVRASRILVDHGTWKNGAAKKNCAKVNFIPNGPFLKIQKENYFLHPPLNLFYIMLLHPIDIMLPHPIKHIFNYYITLTFSLTIYKNWSFISTGKFLFLLIIKLMWQHLVN